MPGRDNTYSKYPLLTLFFSAKDIGTSADQQLKIIETPATSGALAVVDVVMPLPGCIVGASFSKSAAVSAGSISISPNINSSNKAATLTVTNTLEYKWIPYGLLPFAAGADIGCQLISASDLSPTTLDVFVMLFILLEGFSVR